MTCVPVSCTNPDGPVRVTVAATDNNGSGVKELRYTTDGTDPGPGTGTRIEPGGSLDVPYRNRTVKVWGTDNVGNAGALASALVSGVFATRPNGSILY
jgi:hypothetical protein